MKSRRYLSDYRLPSDGEGVGREAVYSGDWYLFPDPGMARNRWLLPLLALLGWAGFAAALLPLSAGGTTFYSLLPLVFAALPLALASRTIPAFWRATSPVKRSDAERLSRKLPAAFLWMLILGGLALLGEGALALFRPERLLPGDGTFALGASAVAGAGGAGFLRRKTLRSEIRK